VLQDEVSSTIPHYLRPHVPGGSCFFTVALLKRRRRLLTADIDALRGPPVPHTQPAVPYRCHRHTPRSRPLHLYVVPDDADFATRWAPDQIVFRPRPSRRGKGYHPEGERNTNGHLATAILGARAGIKGISMRTPTTFTSIPSNIGGYRASPIGRIRVYHRVAEPLLEPAHEAVVLRAVRDEELAHGPVGSGGNYPFDLHGVG
jgi:hypothetical protein